VQPPDAGIGPCGGHFCGVIVQPPDSGVSGTQG
jgi:hypothetical protein